MLALYLFTLILGGGLLLVSVFGGEGGETDMELGGGLDLGGDLEFGAGDLDLGTGLDLSADVEPLDLDLADAGAESAASKIFSLRSLIYASFGFGATGTLLTLLGVGMVVALVTSLGVGAVSGLAVGWVFGYLARTDSGAHLSDETFAGLQGRVVLPISEASPGAVVVERGGREIRLRALPHGSAPEGDPEKWTRVMVVEMERGVAQVIPMEGNRLLES